MSSKAVLSTCAAALMLTFVAAVATGAAGPPGRAQPNLQDLPKEFRQLIPRGRIPSVDDPEFVPAEQAELPGDAWVLGVEIDGEARAYGLNLLNHHEVVNDTIGRNPIAAVW